MLLPEWWPQYAVMLTWPHGQGDWGDNLAAVEQTFIELTTVISQRQRVIISANDAVLKARILEQLTCAGADRSQIDVYVVPSNDIWVRDHGPLTILEDQNARLLDFRFNGWGGKYPAELDNAVTDALWSQGAFGKTDRRQLGSVIEGGGIEVNGEGCLLTTQNCLALPSRNPELNQTALESLFKEYFGCDRVHWLEHGHMAGDDTDGHIDTIARYTDAQTIVYQGCDDPADEHYEPLQALATELAALRRPDGSPYQLHALPLPAALYNARGERLPAGYANFLIINDAVLMPSYANPADVEAKAVLAACFPERELISIDCRSLVEQFGSLHCATMQLPIEVR